MDLISWIFFFPLCHWGEDALIREQCTEVSSLSLSGRLLFMRFKKLQILVFQLRKSQSGDIANEFEQKWGISVIFM